MFTESKFWNKVDKNGPIIPGMESCCWIWKRAKNSTGYGHFGIGNSTVYAHRYSWFLVNGSIPNQLRILHRCDNKICVRPDHLFIGTGHDNNIDCYLKGRHRRGGKQLNRGKNTKPETVMEIRKLYETGNISIKKLSRIFGLSRIAISRMIKRETWKNIS